MISIKLIKNKYKNGVIISNNFLIIGFSSKYIFLIKSFVHLHYFFIKFKYLIEFNYIFNIIEEY